MKTLIAATALSLVAGAAFAGEGQGDPFPFAAPPVSVSMQGYKQAPGTSQNPFPFTAPGQVVSTSAVLPSSGSNGVVQTANSLPPGFMSGPPSANLNRNAPTPAPTQYAQPVAPMPGTRG